MFSRSRADSQGVVEIAPGIVIVTPVIETLNYRHEMLKVAEIRYYCHHKIT